MFGQIFAGCGLGLVVGLLVGLSASPVVAVVVGALAAGLMTLLGFVKSAPADDSKVPIDGSPLRLGSFGVSCAIAILIGLSIRTHNLLSPTIEEQVAEIRKAGYSPEEARKWVAVRNSVPVSATDSGAHGGPAVAPVGASVLFSGTTYGECEHFDTKQFKDARAHLAALDQLGGKYAEYSKRIATLDDGDQRKVLDSLQLLYCPQ